VRLTPKVAQRFWQKVDRDGPVVRPELGPCWPWMGATDDHGYGRFGVSHAEVELAHRVAYELAYGEPPKHGACHRCDVPGCCRPDHLFDGTQAENLADMVAKGRHWLQRRPEGATRGARICTAKLTETDVVAIRQLHASGVPIRRIAPMYPVSRRMIQFVVRRLWWRHVK
jgi:hypothetical protein